MYLVKNTKKIDNSSRSSAISHSLISTLSKSCYILIFALFAASVLAYKL